MERVLYHCEITLMHRTLMDLFMPQTLSDGPLCFQDVRPSV